MYGIVYYNGDTTYICTWEIPRFTLVQVGLCNCTSREGAIQNLFGEIVSNEFLIRGMKSKPLRQLAVRLRFVRIIHWIRGQLRYQLDNDRQENYFFLSDFNHRETVPNSGALVVLDGFCDSIFLPQLWNVVFILIESLRNAQLPRRNRKFHESKHKS